MADEFEGKLTGVYADDFDSGVSDTRWFLETDDDETLRLLPTKLPALRPGANEVEVEGQIEDGWLVGRVRLEDDDDDDLSAAPASGPRKTAVIVFNFANDTRQPFATALVRSRIFTGADSASAFFKDETYTQLSLTGKNNNPDGDVYGYYTLPNNGGACNFTTWATQAKQAAAANGFNAAQYQHVMYVFPNQGACGWAGLAYLPGKESWINGDLSVRVTAHEIGHNLGLNHAGSWDCTSQGAPVTISPTCTVNEYNDPFDNMGGYGDRHSHGYNLQRLGVLQSSNVQTITNPGTYSMTSALEPTSQATTLRIPRTRDSRGNVLDWYYLEIREQGGVFEDFSPTDPALNGVSIRVDEDPNSTSRSKLLDTHPASGGIADAPLTVGETFNDGHVRITPVQAGGGMATVQIAMTAASDYLPPSAPVVLSHSLGPDGVQLSWSASNDDTSVGAYRVFRDGVQIASTGSTFITDTTAAPGSHVYTVYAEDDAGNRSAASPYTVVIPAAAGSVPGANPAVLNPESPSAGSHRGPSIRLKRKRAGHGGLVLVVQARDADGVKRLALSVDGRRVRQAKRAQLEYRLKGHPGSHRVSVSALDRDGNSSSLKRRVRLSR